MAIDPTQLLALWELDEIPACDDSMDLARTFFERAGDAVDKLDDPTKIIAVRGEDTKRISTHL